MLKKILIGEKLKFQKFYSLIVENDNDHYSAMKKTGYWGRGASGILPFCLKTKKFLIGYRSYYVDKPYTWGTFGGALEDEYTPEKNALVELYQETAINEEYVIKRIPIYVYKDGTFNYYNYIGVLEKEPKIILNWENEEYKWVSLDELINHPKLHFGLKAILNDSESLKIMEELSNS